MGICESPNRELELEREGGYGCCWPELARVEMLDDDDRRDCDCCCTCGTDGSLPCASSSAILRCSSLPELLWSLYSILSVRLVCVATPRVSRYNEHSCDGTHAFRGRALHRALEQLAGEVVLLHRGDEQPACLELLRIHRVHMRLRQQRQRLPRAPARSRAPTLFSGVSMVWPELDREGKGMRWWLMAWSKEPYDSAGPRMSEFERV